MIKEIADILTPAYSETYQIVDDLSPAQRTPQSGVGKPTISIEDVADQPLAHNIRETSFSLVFSTFTVPTFENLKTVFGRNLQEESREQEQNIDGDKKFYSTKINLKAVI